MMEIKLSCPVCLEPHFDGVDSLRNALINVAITQLSCPVCQEVLLGLDKLTIHLFSHINKQLHATVISTNHQKTSASNTATSTSTSTITSRSTSTSTSTSTIIEEEINKNIKKIEKETGESRINAASTTNNSSSSLRCDICNFSFSDQTILELHQKLLHQSVPDKQTGLYSYNCHLCRKKFKMRGSLMVHLRVAHYTYSQSYKTRTRFDSEETKNHNKDPDCKIFKPSGSKGPDNKQWECEVCSKLFTTKYFLKKHKRLHTGEMPYTCVQCNKSFTFQQSYHKHMLYHSSEKPYVCNECGRAFKELSTLQNHSRIHSGERPFICETCGKRFRQRVSYLVHRRIHTGAMPYKCAICEKSFRYKVSLRSHKCLSEAKDSSADPVIEISYGFLANGGVASDGINSPGGNIVRIAYEESERKVDNESSSEYFNQRDVCCRSLAVRDTDDITQSCMNNSNNKTEDIFSMMVSPLLPNVESLCLSSNSSTENIEKKSEDLSTINEESLKSLIYDTFNKQ